MTTQPTQIIAVHDGSFHADDVFAVAVLRQLFPNAEIVRTRKPEALATAYIRVDVGGKNDPLSGDYDHHQKGGAGTRPNGVPYASFGLVWKNFGIAVTGDPDVAKKVDEILVQSVDALDCGFKLWKEEAVNGILPFTIASVISGFNPNWDEPSGPGDFADSFEYAMTFATVVLENVIQNASSQVMAWQTVRKAMADATDKRLIVLSNYAPWQEIVTQESTDALYVVFESAGSWRVQCVPPVMGSTAQRKPLPESWAGADAAKMAEVTGVADATFCHNGRFIAGAKTREGALQLAQIALNS